MDWTPSLELDCLSASVKIPTGSSSSKGITKKSLKKGFVKVVGRVKGSQMEVWSAKDSLPSLRCEGAIKGAFPKVTCPLLLPAEEAAGGNYPRPLSSCPSSHFLVRAAIGSSQDVQMQLLGSASRDTEWGGRVESGQREQREQVDLNSGLTTS